MHRNRKAQGFTLIELMLAMAFLSMIFLLVATVTMQLLAIYNRGLAMKQIDQAGSSIIADVNQRANSGLSGSITQGDGFLCIGETKYFWNTQDRLASGANHYLYVFNNDPAQEVGLIKSNPGVTGSPSCQPAAYANTDVDENSVTRLVGDNVRVIGFSANYSASNNHLVEISLTIGTYADDAAARPFLQNGNYQCPPSSLGNFCAVATYKTVVYLPNNPS